MGANVDQIISDYAQPHPALHAAHPFVEAAPQTMPPLEHTDAALTTGSLFLSLFKPPLFLLALSLRAFGVAARDAHALDTSFVRGSFVVG